MKERCQNCLGTLPRCPACEGVGYVYGSRFAENMCRRVADLEAQIADRDAALAEAYQALTFAGVDPETFAPTAHTNAVILWQKLTVAQIQQVLLDAARELAARPLAAHPETPDGE